MKWGQEAPKCPKGFISDWYWFIHPDESQPIVMEVWPSRNYFPNGWWGDQIPKPSGDLPIRLNKSREELDAELDEEPKVKKRRTRKKKEN